MSSLSGTVFDIKEFAVYDGPGIRTTVFLKGCPLRCQWCHNPEGLSPRPQLMVSVAACRHCGACSRVCQSPEQCKACGACIPMCRQGLRRLSGQMYTADELAARLLKDADVYAMGGGVTFSGGEPLLQFPFVTSVIDRLEGVDTAIETSGYAPDSVFQEAMRRCSRILIDWKVSDPEMHRRYTGVDNEIIRRHIGMLAEGETPFTLRMPIIPGVNDNREHFQCAAQLVAQAPALVRVEVLPYQRAAGAKYAMVGKKYAPDFDESRQPEYALEEFEAAGIPYLVMKGF